MSDDRWERLVSYLRRARSKPGFDTEERVYRLEVAGELRRILKVAADGGAWVEGLLAILTSRIDNRIYDLTERGHIRWLESITRPEALGPALGRFLEPGRGPMDKFGDYLSAVGDQRPDLASPPEPWEQPGRERAAVLAFGSLFNFASAPEELPVVRPDVFDLLQQTLGYEWTFQISPLDRYEQCLAFTRDVEERLRDREVPVRDMLDTQSLVQIAGLQADFWAAAAQPHSRASLRSGSIEHAGQPKPYLSVCAAYRDCAADLPEWVEFHRLVGVERFFLYNNLSKDNHLEVLAPHLEDGTVTVRDWPVLNGQLDAYDDCLRWHRHDSRWIAFLDLDEFLFSPTGMPLPDVLADYEAWPGVAVAWTMFGTAGHRTPQPGLVIENYPVRVKADHIHANVKSIVDPTRVTGRLTAHAFAFAHLSAVDENEYPVEGDRAHSPSFERLRINHYHWKSEQEFIAKVERKRTIGRPRPVPTAERMERLRTRQAETGVRDETILMYLPALRQALAARGQGETRAASR